MASCRRTLEDTIAYCKNRKAFGQPIAEFQNTAVQAGRDDD